jgi:hypothetical protein
VGQPCTRPAGAGPDQAAAIAAGALGGGSHRRCRGQGGLITSEQLTGGILTGQPAHPFLVALATRVARATPPSGRYWCVGAVAGQIDPIGPGERELTPAGQGETPSPASDYRYSIFARQSTADCSGVTDPSGRTGTALWMGPASGPSFVTIVDPATGMLLADEFLATTPHGVYAPGTLLQYNLWQPGWRNTLP